MRLTRLSDALAFLQAWQPSPYQLNRIWRGVHIFHDRAALKTEHDRDGSLVGIIVNQKSLLVGAHPQVPAFAWW